MTDVTFNYLDRYGLPKGRTYEDTYIAWLEDFRIVAESESALVIGSPLSWVPLLLYLGAKVENPIRHFQIDLLVPDPIHLYQEARELGRQREYVEMVSTLRAETVDGLWKSDCEWNTRSRDHTTQDEFIIGTYSTGFRPEMLDFLDRVREYRKPSHIKNAIVTNCAADKPYPSPLHGLLLELLPDDSWHLVLATGAFGVVPQELWAEMPKYDAGIPNFIRCVEEWEEFLANNRYERLVIYTEFCGQQLFRAIPARQSYGCRVDFVLPIQHHTGYLDLRSAPHIDKLKAALES